MAGATTAARAGTARLRGAAIGAADRGRRWRERAFRAAMLGCLSVGLIVLDQILRRTAKTARLPPRPSARATLNASIPTNPARG